MERPSLFRVRRSAWQCGTGAVAAAGAVLLVGAGWPLPAGMNRRDGRGRVGRHAARPLAGLLFAYWN